MHKYCTWNQSKHTPVFLYLRPVSSWRRVSPWAPGSSMPRMEATPWGDKTTFSCGLSWTTRKTPADRDQSLALRKTRTETPKHSENKPPPTHTAATPQTSWGTPEEQRDGMMLLFFLSIQVSLFLSISLLMDYKQKLCAASKTKSKMKSKWCIYLPNTYVPYC